MKSEPKWEPRVTEPQQPRRRSANVLTPEVKQRAQALFDEGKSVPEVSGEIGVAGTTLHQAIHDGRLRAVKKKADPRRRQRQL